MILPLTEEEATDLRMGLITAMKMLDKGNFADKILADRLEVIEQRINKIQFAPTVLSSNNITE